jgi:putative hydrolase of the HAD superfamily
MVIKAVVFDMDDTLYEEKSYVLSGFRAVDQFIYKEYGLTGFFEKALLMFNSGINELIFNKVLDQLGVNYDQQTITSLVDYYRAHTPEIQLLEDACWVLEHLSPTIKKALLSDGYLISQQQKVRSLHLIERFDVIVLSDAFGRDNWKPNPFIYEEVRKKLQLDHNQCMYVGDNVKKDFIAANRLGWTTVHIQRDNGLYKEASISLEYDAHYRIDNLRKLSDLYECKQMFIKDGESVHVI